jgi:hypothetical protein
VFIVTPPLYPNKFATLVEPRRVLAGSCDHM